MELAGAKNIIKFKFIFSDIVEVERTQVEEGEQIINIHFASKWWLLNSDRQTDSDRIYTLSNNIEHSDLRPASWWPLCEAGGG